MRLLNSYLCPSIHSIASPGCIIVDRDIWFYSCVDLEPLRPNRVYRKLENRNHLRSMERLLIVRSSNTEWSADWWIWIAACRMNVRYRPDCLLNPIWTRYIPLAEPEVWPFAACESGDYCWDKTLRSKNTLFWHLWRFDFEIHVVGSIWDTRLSTGIRMCWFPKYCLCEPNESCNPML